MSRLHKLWSVYCFWRYVNSNVQVDAALIRGGGLFVDLRGGGGILSLETGGANGPSRAFNRESGRGGTALSQ